MKKQISLIAVLAIVAIVSGCSKNRGLTRRDYSSLNDNPFVEPETAVADYSSSPTPAMRGTSDDAGYVKLDGFGEPASASANAANTRSSMANAQGPSLEDFVGKTSAKSVSLSRTVSEASDPTGNNEDQNDFTGFLEQRTTAGAKVTAESVDHDFTQWARQQKQEWNGAGDDIRQTANAAVGNVNAAIQQASSTREPHSFKPEAATREPQFTDGDSDKSATRLISKPEAQPVVRPRGESSTEAPKSPAPTDSSRVNPFSTIERQQKDVRSSNTQQTPDFARQPQFEDSPRFDDSPQSTGVTTPPAATVHEDPEGLDSTFRFDTGWKPSHLQRP